MNNKKADRIQELLDEALVDCYGEDEEYWSLITALQENLELPMKVKLIGETVKLEAVRDDVGLSYRGIVAEVKYKRKSYVVSLADLSPVDDRSSNADWLAAYRRWLRFEQ